MPTLDWTETVAEVPERGLERRREATAEERRALAADLGVVSVERLAVRYTVIPRAGGRYVVDGRLEAEVTRECVVSLDPVAERIDAPLSVDFAPDGVPDGEAPGIADPYSETEIEPIESGRLKLGRIIEEEIVSRLDPYPRHPDARLERSEAGGEADGGAFAGLAGLKKRLEEGR